MPIGMGDSQRERWVDLEALVDTGASVTAVPSSVLRELGIAPLFKQSFRFAQGDVREMDVGQTWVRVEDKEVVTLVLFNDEGTQPLLGALALEGLFLGVDPLAKRLVPVEGLLQNDSQVVCRGTARKIRRRVRVMKSLQRQRLQLLRDDFQPQARLLGQRDVPIPELDRLNENLVQLRPLARVLLGSRRRLD